MKDSVVSVKKYYYQPEMSQSVVYWSYTLGLICLSIIMLLEKWGFSWVAIVIGLIGLFFVFYGLTRYLQIKDGMFFLGRLLPSQRKHFEIKAIEAVSVGKNGLTFKINQKENVILLRKKDIAGVLSALQAEPSFTASIFSVKKSEGV